MELKDIIIHSIVNEINNKNNVGVITGIARTYEKSISMPISMSDYTDTDINPIVVIVKFIDNEFPVKMHPSNVERIK